jgi:hypothetical protein
VQPTDTVVYTLLSLHAVDADCKVHQKRLGYVTALARNEDGPARLWNSMTSVIVKRRYCWLN